MFPPSDDWSRNSHYGGNQIPKHLVDYTPTIAELQRRFPPLQEERYDVGLSHGEISSLIDQVGVSLEQFMDDVAVYLAQGFLSRTLSFAHCDEVINSLQGLKSTRDGDTSLQAVAEGYCSPDLFFSIYLAFDAGEFHRKADKSDDPSEEHTRLLIEEIVRSLPKRQQNSPLKV